MAPVTPKRKKHRESVNDDDELDSDSLSLVENAGVIDAGEGFHGIQMREHRKERVMKIADALAAASPDHVVVAETEEHIDVVQGADESISYWKLYQYANRFDYFLIVAGSIAAVLHGLTGPAVVYLFGQLNNTFQASTENMDKAYDKVVEIMFIIFYISAVTVVAGAVEIICWMQVGERQATHIKLRYLEALLKQEIGYYDTKAKAGDVVSAISSDIILIHDAVGEKIGTCFYNLAIFFGGTILSISVYWKMGLLGLTTTPWMLGIGGVYVAFYMKYVLKAMAAYHKVDTVAEQAISQVRTVYSFVGENKAVQALSKLLEEASKLGAKTGLTKGIGLGVIMAVSYFSWALQFWYGGLLVQKREIKGGTVNSMIFLSLLAGKAVGDLLQMMEHIVKGKFAAKRLFEIIERESEIDSTIDGRVLNQVEGRIQLRRVSFAYPSRPDIPIFENISLDIPAGKIVALVGSSGSGKSTVISLVERFYDPIKGKVKIDGVNIRKLQLKWLRTKIGLVSQEPTLFATTIKQNILMGKADAGHEEVLSAAKVANAHLFICDLPEGYHTEVGDKGVQLSGGQRQRIAIARAIVRKPAIMLLDEATSALDSESEQLVQKALDNIMHGRTTVVVAHRLSTIRNADVIVVFDKGRIVETGTHDELLFRQNGAYASLVRSQQTGGNDRKLPLTRNLKSPKAQSPLRSAMLKSPVMMGSPMRSPASTITETEYEQQLRRMRISEDLASVSYSEYTLPEIPSMQDTSFSSEIDPYRKTSRVQPHQVRYTMGGWLRGVFSGTWLLAVAGSVAAVMSGVAGAVFPMVMANIIVLLLDHRTEESRKWILGFVGLGFGIFFSSLLQYLFSHRLGANVSKAIQQSSFSSIMRNEVGWFDFEENSSSAVSTRLSSNTVLVRNMLSDTCSYFLQNVIALLLAVTLAILYDWRMGVISAATLPLQVAGSAMTNGFTKDGLGGNIQKSHERAGQVAGEAVASIRTVLSFGAEDGIVNRFKQHLAEAKGRRFRKACIAGVTLGVTNALLYVSTTLCMWYGIRLIRKGAHFAPILISFSIIAYTSYNCVELLRLVPDFLNGFQAIKSMFAIANRKTEIDSEANYNVKHEEVSGNLELKSVSFRYPSRPELLILDNLCLRIRAGTTVALVGSSGSGKSSVLSLLERFYDPTDGCIFIDGRDLKSYNLCWIRRYIGLVQQEPALFGVSIKENIAYGKDGASESEIIAAAAKANAHEFISSLPKGYDTEVGERGVLLSGGQKQRIAIARAIIKNPKILLLDEATSALDAESERIVQDAIDKLVGRNRTTVVVAHRLSTIQSADEIVVMSKGCVVEKGRHSRLLENGGAYANFVHSAQPL